jgi:hypothetical protein
METIIDRIIPELTPAWPMLMITAYAVGGFLILLSGIHALKCGERGAGGKHSFYGIALTFCAGILLLNFPEWMNTLARTLFNSGSEQSLSYSAPSHPGSSYVTFAVKFVRLIGAIGIIRGCVLLRDSASQSPQFFRAVTHFIGGILCVNVVQFINILASTAGGDMQSTVAQIIGA